MITVDASALEKAAELLAGIPGAPEKAAKTAIRKSINGAKTDAKKKVRERYTIKQKYVTRTIQTKMEGLSARLISKGPVNDLSYFITKPKSVPKRRLAVGKYLYSQVVKGQGGTIAHAFLANMQSGHVGVMRRTNGNASLPIEKLAGPSTPQMIGHPTVVSFLETKVEERLSKNMEHEVEAFLMGYRR